MYKNWLLLYITGNELVIVIKINYTGRNIVMREIRGDNLIF